MFFPVIFAGLLLVAVCIILAVIYISKSRNEISLEKRWLNIVVFVLSLVSLIISFNLFRNMGVFADEFGSSPVVINGGWFWLYMDWARLALLFALCVFSGFKLFTMSNK